MKSKAADGAGKPKSGDGAGKPKSADGAVKPFDMGLGSPGKGWEVQARAGKPRVGLGSPR